MAKFDIFAELNQMLAQPNMGIPAVKPDRQLGTDGDPARPHAADVKRLGYRVAKLLHDAARVGPLAAPTRAREHRFRAELSQLYQRGGTSLIPHDVGSSLNRLETKGQG